MLIPSQNLFSHLEKSFSEQSFAPLYFFFGDEPYLIQQAAQYLKAICMTNVNHDFNYRTEVAPDFDVSRLAEEIETLPMMSARRMVWLQEAQDVSEKQWQVLEPLIEKPVSSTVFLITGFKLDKRKKVIRKLIDQAQGVEFRKPFENQMPAWIQQIAKGHGLRFSEEGLQLFHRMSGTSLSEMDAEIRKLKDFMGDRTQIELEDVASSVSRSMEKNVFELIEMMVSGQKAESLMALADLLGGGQSELGVVALFARHLRTLLRLKEAEEEGLAGQKLAQAAQVPPYFLQNYQKQASLWTKKRLEGALAVTADTEKALKSSPLSSHIWLENLILKTT